MDASIYWAWYDWLPSIVGAAVSLWLVWQGWYHRHRFKRLRYAYLAVGACALGKYSFDEIGSLILERSPQGSSIYEIWIAPTLVAVLLSLLGLVALGFAVFWSWKWYQFRRIFGKAPPSSNDEHQWKQAIVDNRLQWLARWLKQTFDFEGAVLREVTKASEVGLEKYPELEQTKQWVAAAKKRFWSAHNIANYYSFKVQPSYKDYLPAKSGNGSPVIRKV